MIPETLNSYRLTLDYLCRLVADVPEDLLSCQLAGAVNHPAWTIGHLAYSAQAIGFELGLAPWLPDDWRERYGTGSIPQKLGYPPKAELLATLIDCERRLGERLTELGESALGKPLPDVRYRDKFPTLGHAVLHILTSHVAVHIGQVAVWRRVIGLGPISEKFI